MPGVPATHLAESPYAAGEEATPDVGLVPAEPFPLRQRARHLALLGVPAWQARGYCGQGIKVAILDSGFRGYRAHLGHALPDQVRCRSFRFDGDLEAKNSQHGILCGEVIHALAPQAELLFANWEPDHPAQFLMAVHWAQEEGARIISCSVIMPSWSDGEGGGPFTEELARLLGSGELPGDLLCFASAGNTAQRHWAGAFRSGTGGFHQWQPGQTENPLDPWGSAQVSVELCSPQASRYEVQVREGRAKLLLSRTRKDAQSRSSVVRFYPRPGVAYSVRVRQRSGGPGFFHLVVLGGALGVATAGGSIACPADGPRVMAVGAVSIAGERLAYSACGPNSPTPKPDLVAPVPFPSLWRDRPFSGTSAAAPQVAGLAALIWSRDPDWNAARIRLALQGAARDLGPRGHDWETGFGLVGLPQDRLSPQLSHFAPSADSKLRLLHFAN